jgi:DNA-binding LacI/PurR family transcriptional regulator
MDRCSPEIGAQGVPVVVMLGTERPSEKVVQITADDEEGFVEATSHLLDLGHERVAMIDQPHYQMGRRAMLSLLKRLENPPTPPKS